MGADSIRIAVQNPHFLFSDQTRNYNGYNYQFFRKYASCIYQCTRPIDSQEKVDALFGRNILYSPEQLNAQADVLLCFNGEPYIFGNRPESLFSGMKIYHTMDFVFRPAYSNQLFEEAGVDFLIGYCDHGKYSGFYQKYYPSFTRRVIPVPFGWGERFHMTVPFHKRLNKCVALGSVNPVNDPCCSPGLLDEYVHYYQDAVFTHTLRRAIVVHRWEWADAIESGHLPIFPETKNTAYDSVAELQKYTMFINDEGIMNFPPARTYEGIAAGCVMVAADNPLYHDLGFRGGCNAVLFKPGDYDDMLHQIRYYINHPQQLEQLQKKSLQLADEYTHEKIVDRLYSKILEIYNGKKQY